MASDTDLASIERLYESRLELIWSSDAWKKIQ
jgi:hypothetical protein